MLEFIARSLIGFLVVIGGGLSASIVVASVYTFISRRYEPVFDFIAAIFTALWIIFLLIVVDGLMNSDIGDPSENIQPEAHAQQVKPQAVSAETIKDESK